MFAKSRTVVCTPKSQPRSLKIAPASAMGQPGSPTAPLELALLATVVLPELEELELATTVPLLLLLEELATTVPLLLEELATIVPLLVEELELVVTTVPLPDEELDEAGVVETPELLEAWVVEVAPEVLEAGVVEVPDEVLVEATWVPELELAAEE